MEIYFFNNYVHKTEPNWINNDFRNDKHFIFLIKNLYILNWTTEFFSLKYKGFLFSGW
jgi:hypothetical protein